MCDKLEALPRHAGHGVHRRARPLWMLQTRNGKRTAKAALKIAVDMVSEGLITR
jgi:phosphoenolpyruvate synthase/pyruvate phosphate dikinase